MTYMYRPMEAAEIEKFLQEPRYGVLGTFDYRNSRVQLNTVWWLHHGERIWMSFFPWSNKLRNIKNNAKVSLCISTHWGDGAKQVILYGEVDQIFAQGGPAYNEALDYELTQKYSSTEEDAKKTHIQDAKDGPWVQLSFMPTTVIGDIYDDEEEET